jgi:diguanylate cyclase (GGDEF)-like protein
MLAQWRRAVRCECRVQLPSDSCMMAEIERYLADPPRALTFPPPLERQFAENRASRRRLTFYNDELANLIGPNLMGVALVASGALTAQEATDSYYASQLVMVTPSLVLLALVRRLPRLLDWVNSLSAFLFLLAMAGLIAVSRCFHGEIALYQAFAMAAVPVSYNLLQTISFRSAVALAAVYIPALFWNAATHPGFSASAVWFLNCFYAILAWMSLTASYRMEASERLNFLNALRERLRSGEIAVANRRLDELSRTDALTQLPNRRDFDERFAAASQAALDDGRPLAVLMIDIDHFKLYNDTLGHSEGDRCIRAVAQAVAGVIGEAPNFAGRVGGEEFAVVLPDVGIDAASAMAASLRSAVQALRIAHPALGVKRLVSVSLGAASLNPVCPEPPEALLARADAALYRAKRAGRDRAEFDLKVVAG